MPRAKNKQVFTPVTRSTGIGAGKESDILPEHIQPGAGFLNDQLQQHRRPGHGAIQNFAGPFIDFQ